MELSQWYDSFGNKSTCQVCDQCLCETLKKISFKCHEGKGYYVQCDCHNVEVHEDKYVSCNFCEYQEIDKSSKTKHTRRMYAQVSYSCEKCELRSRVMNVSLSHEETRHMEVAVINIMNVIRQHFTEEIHMRKVETL